MLRARHRTADQPGGETSFPGRIWLCGRAICFRTAHLQALGDVGPGGHNSPSFSDNDFVDKSLRRRYRSSKWLKRPRQGGRSNAIEAGLVVPHGSREMRTASAACALRVDIAIRGKASSRPRCLLVHGKRDQWQSVVWTRIPNSAPPALRDQILCDWWWMRVSLPRWPRARPSRGPTRTRLPPPIESTVCFRGRRPRDDLPRPAAIAGRIAFARGSRSRRQTHRRQDADKCEIGPEWMVCKPRPVKAARVVRRAQHCQRGNTTPTPEFPARRCSGEDMRGRVPVPKSLGQCSVTRRPKPAVRVPGSKQFRNSEVIRRAVRSLANVQARPRCKRRTPCCTSSQTTRSRQG